MAETYVVGLDQSTQGTKAVLLDSDGRIVARAYAPHRQLISPEGWVSHGGEEIFENCVKLIRRVVEAAGIDKSAVSAIGISNQRETTLAWDRETGKPAAHAVVWQCSRGREITDALTDEGFRDRVRQTTGIPLSPYFPAAKAAWLLRHTGAGELAKAGRLCLGTVDAFLVYKLTGGRVFKTDFSNASRTQLFNIRSLSWDEELCRAFGVPPEALPQVESSDGDFSETTLNGYFDRPVPIFAVMGDSHAALFGQGCVRPGMAKATYGTGSSVMMNVGDRPIDSASGLVTSLAWGRGGKVSYVLEGNLNYSGAVITWLKDDLGLIESAAETEKLAKEANPEDTTYLVPAFTGLGAPYWDDAARASLTGMSRLTGKREVVKAALECIAFQVTDILRAMERDAGITLSELRVDGGPTANRYLMRFQSDIAGVRLRVPADSELSAFGAAAMAGIRAGVYSESVLERDNAFRSFEPYMTEEIRTEKYGGWKNAVNKTIGRN